MESLWYNAGIVDVDYEDTISEKALRADPEIMLAGMDGARLLKQH